LQRRSALATRAPVCTRQYDVNSVRFILRGWAATSGSIEQMFIGSDDLIVRNDLF